MELAGNSVERLGQVCKSFLHVFKTKIDTDLRLFQKETSYLLISRVVNRFLKLKLFVLL